LSWNAIGLAKLDYEDFLQGNYFRDGKIFIDENKETYKALKLPSKGFFSGYGMLSPSLYKMANQASKQGISGNMKGDGFQLGGTFIVDVNGNVIYSHLQNGYADYPKEEDLIECVNNFMKK
jgi:prostamide/prostaglandin F2alpha synthase